MPTYSFKCSTCDIGFDITLTMSEEQPTKCECGSDLRKVFQPIGVTFKGSGFYRTDK